MISPAQIVDLYKERELSQGPLIALQRAFKEVYEGDVWLPLSELSRDEKAAVANLAQQGCDQMSRRVASVLPVATFPALSRSTDVSAERARDRKRLTGHWWHQARMKKVFGRRARHFYGYATAPVMVRPDAKTQAACWEVRDPLNTFPAPTQWDDMTPPDVIFRVVHSLAWLQERYPLQAALLYKGAQPTPDMRFEVLEYCDAEEIVLVALGAAPEHGYQGIPEFQRVQVLERAPNLAGMCLAVIPGRITLDKAMGHFDGSLGMYRAQAELMALDLIAARRAVIPREWLVAPPGGGAPEILQLPDPDTGVPGVVVGATFERQQLDPSYQTGQTIDRLEYAQRQTNMLPTEMGGMSGSNVKTGRRGAQVMGAALDPILGEAQEIFAESLEEETRRAIAIELAWFNDRKSVYVMTRGFQGKLDYTPSTLWEPDADGCPAPFIVEHPLTGVDMENLVIEAGQRVGMGVMSKRTFMQLDPAIPDDEAELDRITIESIREAWLASVQQMAADPQGPWQPVHLGRLWQKITEGVPEWKAVQDLQEEIQKEQVTPVEPGAPETMPGLSMPGQGVEVPPSIPEQGPSLDNLTSMLRNMGTAAKGVPA